MLFEIALLISLGLLVCAVLGANNASACLGAGVGAGFFSYSFSVFLASLGVVLGVALEGTKLSKVLSEGVLAELSFESTLILIVTILIVMTVASVFHLPLPLSEGLVGSAIGIGLGKGFEINWEFTTVIFASWVITPFFAAFLVIILSEIVKRVTRTTNNVLMANYVHNKTTMALSFYVSYGLGANTVGLINGIFKPFVGNEWVGAIMFGLATSLGIYFLSRGITESVGKGITGLSPSAALTVQLSSALTVHLFTQFGLPVSITQALVGSVLGVILIKKISLTNTRFLRKITAGWLLAPLLSLTVSYFFANLF
ncbi:MAG: inorganic phosphate transporter [Candidatus Bathyarchaeia archaeon]